VLPPVKVTHYSSELVGRLSKFIVTHRDARHVSFIFVFDGVDYPLIECVSLVTPAFLRSSMSFVTISWLGMVSGKLTFKISANFLTTL
jgi:hypothetical protein